MSGFPSNLNELLDCINKNGVYKFQVKIVANSKINKIEFFDDYIKIKIKEKPIDGKANKAIVEYLSNILNISKSNIKILSGELSSIKVIGIKCR